MNGGGKMAYPLFSFLYNLRYIWQQGVDESDVNNREPVLAFAIMDMRVGM